MSEHLPKSHSGVSGDSKRRRRYASQGHRARSLSNVGRKGIPRKDINTLFECVCIYSSLLRPTHPAIPCWFPAKHVCRALYALSSLACRYLPRFDAAAVTCSSGSVPLHFLLLSSHAANPEIADVCVRGYQPGLTPAKHCEGKRCS
ncbi:hypothetical protein MTO96_029024 [Rhipicephalus appendiculatus]